VEERMKVSKDPTALLIPSSVVIVTVTRTANETNAMAVTLAGAVCVKPPMVAIGIGRFHYTREIIDSVNEFSLNIPSINHIDTVEFCGRVSGRDSPSKCESMGLTLVDSDQLKFGKLIAQCPVNLECKVRERMDLGSNILFIAEVVAVHIDDNILDKKGNIDLSKMRPIIFDMTRTYWQVGRRIAEYGYLDLNDECQKMVR
jgi:flavin reductase (DIM6/NTAB) family NADH-FMN oxidoreductase RutF